MAEILFSMLKNKRVERTAYATKSQARSDFQYLAQVEVRDHRRLPETRPAELPRTAIWLSLPKLNWNDANLTQSQSG